MLLRYFNRLCFMLPDYCLPVRADLLAALPRILTILGVWIVLSSLLLPLQIYPNRQGNLLAAYEARIATGDETRRSRDAHTPGRRYQPARVLACGVLPAFIDFKRSRGGKTESPRHQANHVVYVDGIVGKFSVVKGSAVKKT